MIYSFQHINYGEFIPVTNITNVSRLVVRFGVGYTRTYKDLKPGVTNNVAWRESYYETHKDLRIKVICYDRYSYVQFNGAKVIDYDIVLETSDEEMPKSYCPRRKCNVGIIPSPPATNGVFQKVPFKVWEESLRGQLKHQEIVHRYHNIKLPTIINDDNDVPMYTFTMPYDYADKFGHTHDELRMIPIYTGIKANLGENQTIQMVLPEGRLYKMYRIHNDPDNYNYTEQIVLNFVPWGFKVGSIYAGDIIAKATILKTDNGGVRGGCNL